MAKKWIERSYKLHKVDFETYIKISRYIDNQSESKNDLIYLKFEYNPHQQTAYVTDKITNP